MDNKLMKKMMNMDETPMKDHEKSAKMDMLRELIREMDVLIGKDLDSEDNMMSPESDMQKVTVAADNQDSLLEGLDKAEDMISKMPMKDMGKSPMKEDDEDMY